eukprot:CAMPEP_0203784440 /NCGR_PEP_ID=MMETSP0100_2-20121128/463_1 /ASSEMBLY_ACC=CAM_ASM_000210 /TAXON_ID=96639 /ORGANISM=" , Strain NY0313808BC1" /LENGTH=377 /DNA_ID=CAMNT_0050686413 /DNA_START=206 /DNA_END=1337 /DNA_ORIENTATION=+
MSNGDGMQRGLDGLEQQREFPILTARTSGASRPVRRPWTREEDDLLRKAVEIHNGTQWKLIATMVPGRSHVQCLQRWRKSLHPSVVKGRWTTHEDNQLLDIVSKNHVLETGWGYAAKHIPGRTAKQCRERYTNHLNPNIKKGHWTPEEDTFILESHKKLGNRWAEISSHLPGRTENSIKIRVKCLMRHKKKLSTAQKSSNSTEKPGSRSETDTPIDNETPYELHRQESSDLQVKLERHQRTPNVGHFTFQIPHLSNTNAANSYMGYPLNGTNTPSPVGSGPLFSPLADPRGGNDYDVSKEGVSRHLPESTIPSPISEGGGRIQNPFIFPTSPASGHPGTPFYDTSNNTNNVYPGGYTLHSPMNGCSVNKKPMVGQRQ